METKPEINALGIGPYRIRKTGKTWTAEELITLGNPACGITKWKMFSGSPTFQAAARQLFIKLGTKGEFIKKDLITKIKSA